MKFIAKTVEWGNKTSGVYINPFTKDYGRLYIQSPKTKRWIHCPSLFIAEASITFEETHSYKSNNKIITDWVMEINSDKTLIDLFNLIKLDKIVSFSTGELSYEISTIKVEE